MSGHVEIIIDTSTGEAYPLTIIKLIDGRLMSTAIHYVKNKKAELDIIFNFFNSLEESALVHIASTLKYEKDYIERKYVKTDNLTFCNGNCVEEFYSILCDWEKKEISNKK